MPTDCCYYYDIGNCTLERVLVDDKIKYEVEKIWIKK